MPNTDMTTPTTISNTEALARLKPELLELPIYKLRPINLDIPTLVIAVTSAIPSVLALRPTIAAALGDAQARYADQLPLCTQATAQAHADYLIALQPTNVQAQSNALVEIREIFAADAQMLVRRKLLAAGELAELRGNVGFANQIYDVFQLVSLYRKHWAEIEGRTGVELVELDHAEVLAQRFTELLAARDKSSSAAGEFGDLRVRAYSHLLWVHDEVRRALSYLRWHDGDVDTILPSLWAGRSRHATAEQPAADGPATPAPVAAEPAVPAVAAPTPVSPAAVTPAAPVTPAVTDPAAPPIAPGLPGASPFMR